MKVFVHDPVADSAEALHEYGIGLTPWDDLPRAAAMVAAVSHRAYQEMGLQALLARLAPGGVFADVKSAWDADAVRASGAELWRL